jgi:glucose/mannose-6-phosphate isomerase
MLDDLKYIHERDAQDALGVAEKQWQQLRQQYNAAPLVNLDTQPIYNVVLAGMGGSALAASILQSWPGLSEPFEIIRGYDIPSYVDKDTLFIASSYSGNTEETLAALAAAEQKGARIVVIASGGKLEEIATAKSYPFYRLPEDFQPRMAVFYNFAALVQLLEPTGLIGEGRVAELHDGAEWLKSQMGDWLPTVPGAKNQAKQLAQECIGKSPVIYAGPKFFPAAYKWKISFNENAKNVAWCNQIPEFNHNEFLGWTSHPTEKPYTVIDLRSNLEHERVQKRFDISEQLLSGRRPAAHVVQARGETLLQQLLWVITLGDFVSLYTALLNGLNPTPVELIEKLKKSLADA